MKSIAVIGRVRAFSNDVIGIEGQMCSICPLCSIFASGPLSDCPRWPCACSFAAGPRWQLQLCDGRRRRRRTNG
jgi:hypothetical protein